MQSFDVTCTGINADQLPKDISVTLNQTDIVSFNITKGIIPTISPTTFKNFINLQSLYITDSKVSNLEDNAFSHALDLQDLSLNNNVLTGFNSRSLSPENRLRTLDLSNNRLNDFADFNISYFPKLNALNLASNLLTHLPVDLVQMLKEQNEFYLVADNNPWNCSHPNWSEYLTDQLVNAFCTNKTFGQEIDGRMIENGLDARSEPTDENDCKKADCTKYSFYYCLLWSFCGIWIGIIVGNIGKIKNLICGRPVAYADEYTQCGKYLHLKTISY